MYKGVGIDACEKAQGITLDVSPKRGVIIAGHVVVEICLRI
jgi:hypothetical protein